MNPSSDIGSALPGKNVGPGSHPQAPANWREALMALIASRVSLIQLEAKDTSRKTVRRISLVAAACGCAFFFWALLLAGGVSWGSEVTGWPWNRLAVGAAGLHLLAAILLARAARSPAEPSFPVTRAEFQKDREWIENFQHPNKSND